MWRYVFLRRKSWEQTENEKASKILTLILVVVLLCGMFTGCAMFGRDALKYRDMTAITVGNEVITVGKVLDTFNNYYNNYYSYISAGYVTLDQVVDMAVTSLYTQAMKVDSYVKTATAETHSYTDFCHNAPVSNGKRNYVCNQVCQVPYFPNLRQQRNRPAQSYA